MESNISALPVQVLENSNKKTQFFEKAGSFGSAFLFQISHLSSAFLILHMGDFWSGYLMLGSRQLTPVSRLPFASPPQPWGTSTTPFGHLLVHAGLHPHPTAIGPRPSGHERRWRHGTARTYPACVRIPPPRQPRRPRAAYPPPSPGSESFPSGKFLNMTANPSSTYKVQWERTQQIGRRHYQGKIDSVRRSRERGFNPVKETKETSNKFIGRVEEILKNLPKPVEWQPFNTNELPYLLSTCREVQDVSIRHNLIVQDFLFQTRIALMATDWAKHKF